MTLKVLNKGVIKEYDGKDNSVPVRMLFSCEKMWLCTESG